jgi:hypothetical protein
MYPRRHVHCIVFISCLCHYGALLVPTIYTLHSMCMYVCKYVSMYVCLIFRDIIVFTVHGYETSGVMGM